MCTTVVTAFLLSFYFKGSFYFSFYITSFVLVTVVFVLHIFFLPLCITVIVLCLPIFRDILVFVCLPFVATCVSWCDFDLPIGQTEVVPVGLCLQ